MLYMLSPFDKEDLKATPEETIKKYTDLWNKIHKPRQTTTPYPSPSRIGGGHNTVSMLN